MSRPHLALLSSALFCALYSFAVAARAANPQPAPTPSPNPPAAHSLDRADLEPWLDGFMPYAIERGDVAGAVVAVVKNGEVIFAKGYGFADVGKHKPVDAERTMFRPGSISKLFTWTAVMQLVEQGKLDLDHDVNEYLDFKIPPRADGPITLRDIMTHTPGFEEQIKELIVSDPKRLVPLKVYAEQKTPVRIFKAGSTPAYSNYATALAGYIVERVSGQPFDDYIDAHLFKPLEMTHATFRQPLPAAFQADMSQGYALGSQPPKPYEIVVAAPAGSLAASGVDMAHFMIAHLEGGEYHGARILGADTLKMMHETPRDMIPPLNRMMLGFYEQNYNGHRVISHGGDTVYMHSYLHLLLDDHVGLFVSLNSQGREGAAGAIRGALFDDFLDRYFPGTPDVRKVDAKTAAEHAKLMAGYYESSRRAETSFMSILSFLGPFKLSVGKDNLLTASSFKGRNGAPRYYREVAPFVWRDVDSGWRLAAKVVDGHVQRFSIDEISPFTVYEPSRWWRSPGWLLPAVEFAFTALLLTALLWPVAAIVRRRNNLKLDLVGRDERGRVLSRVGAVAVTVVSLAWVALFISLSSRTAMLGPGIDPVLFLMHLVSILGYVGGAIILIWAAAIAWTGKRRWPGKIWTSVLAVSAVAMLWMAWVYHLTSFTSRY
ncbi:MAG TPA: serine hydrolase domain-containing protein [Steroidobacteraceae bacterium]